MPTFRQADKPDLDLLQQVIAEWHPHLKEYGVTIGLLYAHATRDEQTGEPKGPSLKHHGYPAEAIVQLNNLQKRVEGLPDATIKVDGDQWEGWTLNHKRALLDHEVRHLELQTEDDEQGTVKLDDAGRPKLKILPHDYQCAGFYDVAERHKDHSGEVQQLRSLKKEFVQGVFSFG